MATRSAHDRSSPADDRVLPGDRQFDPPQETSPLDTAADDAVDLEDVLSELWPLARRHTRSDDEAGDALQMALVQASKPRAPLRDPSQWMAWLRKTVKNAALELRRRNAVRTRRRSDRDPDELSVGIDPLAIAQSNEGCAALLAALDGLPRESSSIIRLRGFENMSYDQVGQQLGLTAEQVRQRLYYARTKLRKALDDLGWGHLLGARGREKSRGRSDSRPARASKG